MYSTRSSNTCICLRVPMMFNSPDKNMSTDMLLPATGSKTAHFPHECPDNTLITMQSQSPWNNFVGSLLLKYCFFSSFHLYTNQVRTRKDGAENVSAFSCGLRLNPSIRCTSSIVNYSKCQSLFIVSEARWESVLTSRSLVCRLPTRWRTM